MCCFASPVLERMILQSAPATSETPCNLIFSHQEDGISKATEITRELCADRPLRVKSSSCCGHIIMVVLASPTKWEESSVKG
jgi:hypothetical protein